MDSRAEIFLERANNELLAAASLQKLSEDTKEKTDFELPEDITFYSSVISHSYYAIFHAAKAILMENGIKTAAPKIHKKTFDAFKKELVDSGQLDVQLLKIYKMIVIRADELLSIFDSEKQKRGHFTYKTIPQANKKPADDSLKNAKLFVSNIAKVLRR